MGGILPKGSFDFGRSRASSCAMSLQEALFI
jgi:hypothetical protein